MKEYIELLDVFAIYPHSSFSKLIPINQWGNRQQAEEYLKKYWLSQKEYINVWKKLQDKVFYEKRRLPDLVYQSGYKMLALRGGCLFNEESFNQLQKAMDAVGDEYFVIIQQSQEFTNGEPMFRMKFPVNISWNELSGGNYISAVMLEMSYNEYFVFSESGSWGKYTANDYDFPLDIIGFKPNLEPIFQNHFRQTEEELNEILSWMPWEYKKLIREQ
ncbi:hypothetical protein [Algoriphagus antarcticus]|uniref:Uncharacterized protein n=1 Tax=Algoriphagus antarcticus TaxID=238540 RepID=A0A3E0D1H7_9BACT|nr:hypothetical protein [Algoriphagus antarcticus]REG74767.1 hypothetical protein C8N25_1633 [Algoriphagus antarcticus]